MRSQHFEEPRTFFADANSRPIRAWNSDVLDHFIARYRLGAWS